MVSNFFQIVMGTPEASARFSRACPLVWFALLWLVLGLTSRINREGTRLRIAPSIKSNREGTRLRTAPSILSNREGTRLRTGPSILSNREGTRLRTAPIVCMVSFGFASIFIIL